MISEQDRHFMQKAIELAKKGMDNDLGGPFGAIIVNSRGEIVGEGCNRVTSTNDPTAHAEVVAIRDACQNLDAYQLQDCTIYSSCEPCPMCLGAIYWARPKRLVFACSRKDAAEAGFDDDFIYKEIAVDIKDRQIQTAQILRREAIEVFKKWELKNNKAEY